MIQGCWTTLTGTGQSCICREKLRPALQILVTSNDFADPEFRKNLSLTAEDLLSMNVVPVFNENDAISSRQNSADVSILLLLRWSCTHYCH